jgi:hypothetical protein
MLLASTLSGLLAPAVVAMSKDGIASVAHQEGLSSKVKDFFVDVLEDALTRSAAVAQLNSSTPSRVIAGGRVLFVLSGSADFSSGHEALFPGLAQAQPRVASYFTSNSFGTSGLQPLGP